MDSRLRGNDIKGAGMTEKETGIQKKNVPHFAQALEKRDSTFLNQKSSQSTFSKRRMSSLLF